MNDELRPGTRLIRDLAYPAAFTARIDGIHFEVPAATEIAERLVGPSLVNFALS